MGIGAFVLGMAVERITEIDIGTGRQHWIAGGTAGLAAGIVFGLLAMVIDPGMMGMIGATYGFAGSVVAGWIAHLFHATVIGLIFAAITGLPRLREHAGDVAYGVVLGVAYGIIVWVVAAPIVSVVMPVWLGMLPPNFGLASFAGHLVYGVVLGSAYPLLFTWLG